MLVGTRWHSHLCKLEYKRINLWWNNPWPWEMGADTSMPSSFFLPGSNFESHSTLLLRRFQHNLTPVPTAVTNLRTTLVLTFLPSRLPDPWLLSPGITSPPPKLPALKSLSQTLISWGKPSLPKWPRFSVCFTTGIPLYFKGLITCKSLNLFRGHAKKLLTCEKQQITNQSWRLRVSSVVIWVHILNLHCFLYNVYSDQKPPSSELIPWLQ